MSASSTDIVLPRAPWEGGSRNMVIAVVVGVIGLVLWFAVDGLRGARSAPSTRGCGRSSTG